MRRVSNFAVGVGVCLAVCCVAAAQSAITGRLLQKRGETLSPVRHCTVYASSARSGPLIGEYPNDQGRFRFDFPPDSSITVGLACPGFRLVADAEREAGADGEPSPPVYNCSRPGLCADVQLVIEPLAAVEGEAVDDSGVPVEQGTAVPTAVAKCRLFPLDAIGRLRLSIARRGSTFAMPSCGKSLRRGAGKST